MLEWIEVPLLKQNWGNVLGLACSQAQPGNCRVTDAAGKANP